MVYEERWRVKRNEGGGGRCVELKGTYSFDRFRSSQIPQTFQETDRFALTELGSLFLRCRLEESVAYMYRKYIASLYNGFN